MLASVVTRITVIPNKSISLSFIEKRMHENQLDSFIFCSINIFKHFTFHIGALSCLKRELVIHCFNLNTSK